MNHIKENWDCRAIASEVTLHYISEKKPKNKISITSPEEAAGLLWDIFPKEQMELKERFCLILLDNAKHCLGWSVTSIGGKTATVVDTSEVVTIALLGAAQSVIISHNHPSGVLRPSMADLNLTRKLTRALSYLGITLEDHIILNKNSFYSFKAHGDLSHV